MSIRFECDQCGSVLKIKDDLAGKPGKCPKCKTAFTVPAPEDEPVSSGESASNEASDDSGATSAKDKPGGPNKDFDLDAFLLDDDGGKLKTAKSRASKPRQQEDERSDDIDDVPDEPATKSKKDQEGDGFSIRRGPDTSEKRPKPASLPDQEDEKNDESSAPARRPPGTNPNAHASNIASDLLSKSAKKGKKASWNEIPPEKRDEEQYDWEGMRREVLKKFLPLAVGGIVLCFGLYKLVNSAMGSKTFVPPLGHVTGTVTVNAKPIVGAEVWFYPENNKIKSGDKEFKVTASQGLTDANGHYELTYIGDLKGAVVGTCRVQIVAAGRRDIAAQYLGFKATATQTVKTGKQVIDLEVSQ